MEQKNYKSEKFPSSVFVKDEKSLRLAKLFGFLCGNNGKSPCVHPQSSDLFYISAGAKRYIDADLLLDNVEFSEKEIFIKWHSKDGTLEIESRWEFSAVNGIMERRDSVKNISSSTLRLSRCFSRFVFTNAKYEIYKQDSFWSNENQGVWTDLSRGDITLGCRHGRTNEGNSPYLAIREKDFDGMISFHLLPIGDWRIRVSELTEFSYMPYCAIDMGISDEHLAYDLAPGEKFEMPAIIIQSIPENEPHYGAPRLHRHIFEKNICTDRKDLPVIYNTWFDRFQFLNIEHLRNALKTAKEIGCEVFVIDAGWFGANKAVDWFSSVGDWDERTDVAFHGNMKAFADEVRAAGLGFGFWMEPERVTAHAPVLKTHPEWFIPMDGFSYRVNLCNKEAADYIYSKMCELVEKYSAVFMKIDMNAEQGIDLSGRALYDQTKAWFEIVDRVKSKHPELHLEHCASGGMRSDMSVLNHFDSMFPSDNAHPLEEVKITQGLAMRLMPGRISHWIVFREIEQPAPRYDALKIPHYIAPQGGIWNNVESVDPVFAILSKFCGVPGFSSEISAYVEETKKMVKFYVDFFKARRSMLMNSAVHLLSRPFAIDEKDKWISFQMQSMDRKDNVLLIYNNPACGQYVKNIRLRDLDEKLNYKILVHTHKACSEEIISGEELMKDGLHVSISGDAFSLYQARLYTVTALE